MRPLALTALLLVLVVTGCESTQSKSARIGTQGPTKKERGLVIDAKSRDVDSGDPTVLTDPNGTVVAVEIENTTKEPLRNVPIGVDVADPKGKSVYRNDTPGLEASLTSISLLRAGESVVWVNDQVTPAGEAAAAKVTVGAQSDDRTKIDPKTLPKMRVTPGSLVEDPVSGIEATGYVYNDSKFEQRRLVIYCVARKGKKIVAAGRSVIQKIKPGRRGRYHVFFIGNPTGAELELSAPPTVFE